MFLTSIPNSIEKEKNSFIVSKEYSFKKLNIFIIFNKYSFIKK